MGIDFHPDIRTGDKSFWLDALPFLAERHQRLSIVSSVRGVESRISESRMIGDCEIQCVYLPPTTMARSVAIRRTTLQRLKNVVGKAMTARRLVRETARVVREAASSGSPVTTVHLLDNFGPWMSRAIQRLPAVACISAVSLMGHESGLYEKYLRRCYGGGIHVVPYSDAFAGWLESRGIDGPHIHPVKWGVTVPEQPVSAEARELAKQSLGVPAHHTLVLWAGYIQQVGHDELLDAYQMARSVTSGRDDIHFFFALKPECFGDGEAMPSTIPGRITVSATRTPEFMTALDAADYLLSYTLKRRAIMAPPLTWFEAMARGTPVMTLSTLGVDEVISSGSPGFVADERSQLASWLADAQPLQSQALIACNLRAQEVGSVRTSAYRLCDVWDGLTATDRRDDSA